MKRLPSLLAPALLAVLLAACGGGGSDVVPVVADPLAEVPASASESAAGMAGYVSTLTSLPAESREPVGVDNFSPPRPEDTEPEPVG